MSTQESTIQEEQEQAQASGEEIFLDDDAFEPGADDLVEIGVLHPRTGALVGTMFLKHVGMAVIDRYRDLRNGDGRNRGNPGNARRFLFRTAFVRFEPTDPKARLPLKPKQSELDYFLGKEKLVDRTLLEYLGQTYPEVDLSKS